MPGHRCIVPGCKSGYDSCPEKHNFFMVPKDSFTLQQWAKAIPRKDFIFKPRQAVCDLHFRDDEIIRKKVLKDNKGTILAEALYSIPKLKEGAVPSIFPNCPKYLTKSSNQRKPPLIRSSPQKKLKIVKDMNYLLQDEESVDVVNARPVLVDSANIFSFFSIQENVNSIVFPNGWSRHDIPGKLIMFSYYIIKSENLLNNEIPTPILFKRLCLGINLNFKCSVMGKEVNSNLFGSTKITCSNDLETILRTFDIINICKGYKLKGPLLQTTTTFIDLMGNIRHVMCPLIIGLNNDCKFCNKAIRTIMRKRLRYSKTKTFQRIHISLSPDKQILVQQLRKKHKLTQQQKYRLETLNKKLKTELFDLQDKMAKLSSTSLEEVLSKNMVPSNQRVSLHEILAASQVSNPKGRRYSENWILLCLLFHIRSPCGYNFMRNNDILPLPCVRTIRRYLSSIDNKCGFDSNFLQLFALHLSQKSEFQRHGIIIFDEISTRESVSVNSQNLTYTGLVDFGENGEKGKSFDEKANHGLVFMFQPLADTYTQTIGVFASKGPTKGVILAQLILKAITLVENAGALIHGIVCDGAAPNRKFWNEMGISGKIGTVKNWFEHPVDENRKIFVFSDTPHLFKNVRNRLYNNKELQVNEDEPLIKWDHFHIVYNQDKLNPGELRVCPRISASHLILNSSAKMRVRLAVQVLSRSMAKGLEFYRPYCPELKDSTATENFCLILNSAFDALNKKLSGDGVSLNSNDFNVLENTLTWLNDWEKRVIDKIIKPCHFLTCNTAEGLRVTLTSTMDICCYLKEKYDFKYVLTGKINQDPLERFFGTIRQAGGANDHPATPTFLQLYKLLSVYSVLKPPNSGNCTVSKNIPAENLITLDTIKKIYKDSGEQKSVLERVREKLNFAIEYEEWNLEDVLEINDHDYNLVPVIDCIVYYVTGYMCKQLLRYFKCLTCRSAFKQSSGYSQVPVSRLVNLKSMGGLIHPNQNFFLFICKIEQSFSKYCEKSDVFELVLTELIENNSLTFPCFQHCEEVMSFAIRYYINMRMRQYSLKHNNETKKENMRKKKEAKYTKT